MAVATLLEDTELVLNELTNALAEALTLTELDALSSGDVESDCTTVVDTEDDGEGVGAPEGLAASLADAEADGERDNEARADADGDAETLGVALCSSLSVAPGDALGIALSDGGGGGAERDTDVETL